MSTVSWSICPKFPCAWPHRTLIIVQIAQGDVVDLLDQLRQSPRVTVRRDGAHDPDGRCVLYWMQRAQRSADNPALDVAIAAGNALGLPVVAFLGVVQTYPHANLRHYAFLADGVPDLAA